MIILETISGATPQGRVCGAFVLGATLALIGPDRLGCGPQMCLISVIIRRPCPGCGMTRAAAALLRGDVRRAMRTNPRIILVALVGGAIMFRDVVAVVQQPTKSRLKPALSL
jgi:hypothetical protein